MELLALSSLLNGMPILVLGLGSDPTAVGDRARHSLHRTTVVLLCGSLAAAMSSSCQISPSGYGR